MRVRHIVGIILATTFIFIAVSWTFGTGHWLGYMTGSLNTSGAPPNYNFWSGFGSDLGEYVIVATLVTHLSTYWNTNTCHRHWWCWRKGSWNLDGTPYMLCHIHHPDDNPSVDEAIAAYETKQPEGTGV